MTDDGDADADDGNVNVCTEWAGSCKPNDRKSNNKKTAK